MPHMQNIAKKNEYFITCIVMQFSCMHDIGEGDEMKKEEVQKVQEEEMKGEKEEVKEEKEEVLEVKEKEVLDCW